jgi:hypothetical protein
VLREWWVWFGYDLRSEYVLEMIWAWFGHALGMIWTCSGHESGIL